MSESLMEYAERTLRKERDRLVAERAWDEGFTAHAHEEMRQREDPSHPITRVNPYAEAEEWWHRY